MALSPKGLLTKFTGRTVSEGVAFSFGVATGPVLAPAVEIIRQEAWAHAKTRILSAQELAALVAEGVVSEDQALTTAHRNGYGDDAFGHLVDIARTAPDVGTLRTLWRRGLIDAAGFEHGLRKAKLEPRWTTPLEGLKEERLDPAVLATAIQRGLIPDPGILPVAPPTGAGKVKAFPVFDIDALTEAEAHGIDKERLSVMVGEVGLPLALVSAAQALFRGIITETDFRRAVSEGNTRNEWGDAALEVARQIPAVANYVNAYLRGWITQAELHAGAAKHGMSAADVDLLALAVGRPATTRQAFIGYTRGGRVQGHNWNERETFRRAVIQSNIRPEWEPILWAQRYTYPSAFVLRALTQAGDISQAQAEQILVFEGWEPTLAAQVAKSWAAGGGTSAKTQTKAELAAEYEGGYITEAQYRTALAALGYSGATLNAEVALGDARRVKSYRDAVVRKLEQEYVLREIDDATATTDLAEVGVTAEAARHLLAVWSVARDTNVRALTGPQIVKAYKRALFTEAEALQRLEDLGYTPEDSKRLMQS